MMSGSWCREHADGAVTLTVHVQPGARKTEVVGVHGDALKIRLAAPAVDGKANYALIGFVAGLLNVARANVELVSGATIRRKLLKISGAEPGQLKLLRASVQSD
jgi:uncharacterized protein